MALYDDVIWAAGFFDGEGCIVINRQAKHRSVYFWMDISAYQNDPAPLNDLRDMFGGEVRRESDGWKWRACGPTAGAALEEMLPYLRVKGAQAQIAIAFQERRLAKGKPRPKDFSIEKDVSDHSRVKRLKKVVV